MPTQPTLTDTQARQIIYSLCEHYQQNSNDSQYLELAHTMAYTDFLLAYFEGVIQALGIVYPIP
ncbi:hypothetical protein [Pseudanabaena sp. 'Roaring Creek']|uniref:hypothetical protein n=1 Tax=Pseudanabaena sp. 'Roaring Creek' TaxID=1681830 RepID=UPI0006D81A91|nr:hypothetical protein [Pseudanabaena sp. 'Roaring Creek']